MGFEEECPPESTFGTSIGKRTGKSEHLLKPLVFGRLSGVVGEDIVETGEKALFFGRLPRLEKEGVKEIKTILFGRVPRLDKTHFDDINTILFGRVPRINTLFFDDIKYLVGGTVPPIKTTKAELVKNIAYGRVPSLSYSKSITVLILH